MKKILIIIVVVLFTLSSTQAQVIISEDTITCGVYTDTLHATSAVITNINSDDINGDVLSIGFTFDFYGLSYDYLVVSGNGYISFDTTIANTGSPWSIPNPVPNQGTQPQNAILAPWQDINSFTGGGIYYSTSGIAPNRK